MKIILSILIACCMIHTSADLKETIVKNDPFAILTIEPTEDNLVTIPKAYIKSNQSASVVLQDQKLLRIKLSDDQVEYAKVIGNGQKYAITLPKHIKAGDYKIELNFTGRPTKKPHNVMIDVQDGENELDVEFIGIQVNPQSIESPLQNTKVDLQDGENELDVEFIGTQVNPQTIESPLKNTKVDLQDGENELDVEFIATQPEPSKILQHSITHNSPKSYIITKPKSIATK